MALALDYSANCGFEYDLLIAARPDVLLGVPLSFYNKDGKETRLHRALPPYNEVLHSHIMNKYTNTVIPNGDFHHIFNAANARMFVEKMFPPPSQKWPDLTKLTTKIGAHSGFVQEFARNNGIVMSNDGLGPPQEEIVRKIWYTNNQNENKRLEILHLWRGRLGFLGLPDHCFPSAADGWQAHIDSNDPQCFPKYHDAQDSCPPNQNIHLASTL